MHTKIWSLEQTWDKPGTGTNLGQTWDRNKPEIPSTWMGDHLVHEEPDLEAI